MKKNAVLCILLCALLVGCGPKSGSSSTSSPGESEPSKQQSVSDVLAGGDAASSQILTDAMRYRLEYYEELTRDLQEEVVALKSQLYTAKVEYEALLKAMQGGDLTTNSSTERNFVYTVQDGGAILTAYMGQESVLILPKTLGGYPLTQIGEGAFRANTALTSLTIPDSVTRIDWFAFSGCVFLSEIRMGANLTSISYGAFENCSSSLVFYCPDGSYAQVYARSYGIRTIS